MPFVSCEREMVDPHRDPCKILQVISPTYETPEWRNRKTRGIQNHMKSPNNERL